MTHSPRTRTTVPPKKAGRRVVQVSMPAAPYQWRSIDAKRWRRQAIGHTNWLACAGTKAGDNPAPLDAMEDGYGVP